MRIVEPGLQSGSAVARIPGADGSNGGLNRAVGGDAPDDVGLVVGEPQRPIGSADESEGIVQRCLQRRAPVPVAADGSSSGDRMQCRGGAAGRNEQAGKQGTKGVHGRSVDDGIMLPGSARDGTPIVGVVPRSSCRRRSQFPLGGSP